MRQVLVDGNNRGLFVYPRPRASYTKEQLLDLLKKNGSRGSAQRASALGSTQFARLLKANGITREDIDQCFVLFRKQKAIDEYEELVSELGGIHPSSTDVQRHDKALYARILRYWNGLPQFRADLGIPEMPLGNPRFLDDAVARLREVQAEQRDRIRAAIIEATQGTRCLELGPVEHASKPWHEWTPKSYASSH